MWIITRLEGDKKYGIRITVIFSHEVLTSITGTNWESSSIVRVKFADVLYVDVDFPRRFAWWYYSQRDGLTINWFRFVYRRPCLDWTICTMMIFSEDGQYLAALAYVTLGQDETFQIW